MDVDLKCLPSQKKNKNLNFQDSASEDSKGRSSEMGSSLQVPLGFDFLPDWCYWCHAHVENSGK